MSSNQIKGQEILKSMQRRQFGRAAVGMFAVVGLAACGGGGEGDDGDSEFPLRDAYYKINEGMSKDEVLAIVGREPEGKSEGTWNYRSVPESLMISFEARQGMSGLRVINVYWNTNRRVPGLTLSK